MDDILRNLNENEVRIETTIKIINGKQVIEEKTFKDLLDIERFKLEQIKLKYRDRIFNLVQYGKYTNESATLIAQKEYPQIKE